ncbi:DUF4062 domain-containing protein [Microbulbifer yueqingensis]|uniref:DUF4062 domain-containing protein n=1 Tax=Microbulbifer yueqingensis TaxID=658219 RepID=A0A1G9EGA6_9GAMM|nr:DUF4062 domain-containing protein [Microbulbifer yueqingensis]SDK75065.1 protein of unknown function [Microbulbifer yueqingensis]
MNINRHTSHPSAFISSTFVDLRPERLAVASALNESGLNVNALDIQPASNDSSKRKILEGIKQSDFVVLIIGDRYGTILPEMTGSPSLSITQWEYQRAKQLQKNILVYFKEGENLLSDDLTDPAYKKKRLLFQKFKNLVTSNHNPKFFHSEEQLVKEVQSALIPIYREGVLNLLTTNTRLKSEIEQLRSDLSSINRPKIPESQRNALANIMNTSDYGLSDSDKGYFSQATKNIENRLLGLADLARKDDKEN